MQTPSAPVLIVYPMFITVSFNPYNNAQSFKIQRDISSSFTTFITLGSVNVNNNYFNDSSVVYGTTYYYRLIAIYSNGEESAPSPVSSIVFLGPPAAPTNVTASANSTTSINIVWETSIADGGSPITHYYLEKSTDLFDFSLVDSNIPYTATSYLISDLSSGSNYYFRVSAANAVGRGTPDYTISTSTLAEAPTNVASYYVNSSNEAISGVENSTSSTSMFVSFTPPSGNGITGYNVYSGSTQVGSGTASPILITGLTEGVSYQFTVKAITKNSANENQLSASSAPSASRIAADAGSGNTGQMTLEQIYQFTSNLNGGTVPAQITIPDIITGTPTMYNALVTDVTMDGYNTTASNTKLNQVMRVVTPSGTNNGKVVVQTQTASGNKTSVASVAVVGSGVNPTVTVADPTATMPSRAAITTSSLPSGARVMFGVIDEPSKLSFIIKAFDATDNVIILSASPIPVLIHKPHLQVVEGSGYKSSLYFSHYNPTSSVEEGITLTRAPTSDIGSGESLMVAYSGTININMVLTEGVPPATPSDPTAICFLGDAPILTPRGYRRADSLRVGDKVRTADGRSVAVQRVFTKTYQPSASVNPYVIPAGLFGATEDVMISPEHLVAVSGKGLVEARKLGLKQHKMAGEFTYYNIELPNWQTDNLVIGGVEAESLAPVRRLEITKGEFLTLLKTKYGKLTPDVIARACRTCFMTASGKVNIPVFSPSAKK